MYHFCTYFDSNYLLRGLGLYRSLSRHCENFMFYPLCLDDEAYRIIVSLNMENVRPIRLGDLEAGDEGLATAKQNRSRIEYYFTLSPVLPLYLLDKMGMDVITYLDSDLFFYGSLEPIYSELGDMSILITEHRFPESQRFREKYGRYNIQYQSFRNDEQGRQCLSRWRVQCIDWCYDRLEEKRFADQKYLDEWPGMYDRLVVSANPGVGVAPWNLAGRRLEFSSGRPLIDGKEMIFYHFHGLKVLNSWVLFHGIGAYGAAVDDSVRRLYREYIGEMNGSADQSHLENIGIGGGGHRSKSWKYLTLLKWVIGGQLMSY